MCQNNLEILKLLRLDLIFWIKMIWFPFFVCFSSEEVFDFSSGQMTQAKAKHLKDTMCTEFTKIFQLCEYVVVIEKNNKIFLDFEIEFSLG